MSLIQLQILLAASGLLGEQNAEPTCHKYQIGLVLFDFYSEHVKLTIDGDTIIDELITVDEANETTGLSRVTSATVRKCSKFEVETVESRFAEIVCVTPQTRFVYIRGGSHIPRFLVSNSANIELD